MNDKKKSINWFQTYIVGNSNVVNCVDASRATRLNTLNKSYIDKRRVLNFEKNKKTKHTHARNHIFEWLPFVLGSNKFRYTGKLFCTEKRRDFSSFFTEKSVPSGLNDRKKTYCTYNDYVVLHRVCCVPCTLTKSKETKSYSYKIKSQTG